MANIAHFRRLHVMSFVRHFVLVLVTALCSCSNIHAQESPPETTPQSVQKSDPVQEGSSSEKKDNDTDEEKDKEKRPSRGSFVVAPLPLSSPAIGDGVIPVLGYIFPFSKNDGVSPPSTVGVAGLYTNDGSRGFALGGELYFKENTYKATFGFAHGNIDYNLYGFGILTPPNAKLPLKQTGHAFFGEFLRRLGWGFFLGPRFFNGDSVLTLNGTNNRELPIPPDLGFHDTLRAIGFRLQRDTTLNHFYPTQGTFTDFTTDFFSEAIGSKYSYQSYKLTFNKYISLTKKQVLAFGSNFCGTGGQPPFYGNCIYGTGNQLRGYTAGRYFDRFMMTSQAEYRLVLPKGFGLVAFGGIGGVIPGAGQVVFRYGHFLPSGGGGLRYALSRKYHVNLRADLAEGRDGHTFSMGVGEAF
jgi:Omp85 superfamily domain